MIRPPAPPHVLISPAPLFFFPHHHFFNRFVESEYLIFKTIDADSMCGSCVFDFAFLSKIFLTPSTQDLHFQNPFPSTQFFSFPRHSFLKFKRHQIFRM